MDTIAEPSAVSIPRHSRKRPYEVVASPPHPPRFASSGMVRIGDPDLPGTRQLLFSLQVHRFASTTWLPVILDDSNPVPRHYSGSATVRKMDSPGEFTDLGQHCRAGAKRPHWNAERFLKSNAFELRHHPLSPGLGFGFVVASHMFNRVQRWRRV